MAQSKYLKQNGEIIYPYTIMDNIFDSETGNSYLSTLENKIKVLVEEEVTLTISSGYATFTYPTGIDNNNYYLPIIQPVYLSSGLLGGSAVVQKNGDSACYIYVRQGTTTPANNSQIKFNAYGIHK